ncbi:hypothetical protein P8935_24060 [Telmatobacter sp. DSM 110680]|uniref:Uncharacterized protein n=1 Tax=Telmatobacter sp. DSM 110680 TaxID=3036704 RepID=A0AAU7DIF8_9BACT
MDHRRKPTKTCPYCAETVLKAALKCKHCGEFFDDSGGFSAASIRRSSPITPQSDGKSIDSFADGLEQVILFENRRTGQRREAPVGFSFTNLFFGFFVPLFRGDLKWAVIQFFAALFTAGLCWLVFPFIYNGLYINDLEASGFRRVEPPKLTREDGAEPEESVFPCPVCGKNNTALADVMDTTATWQCADCSHQWTLPLEPTVYFSG